MKESVLNVPLKNSTREWLQDRCEETGRAERREVQHIVEMEKARDDKRRNR